MKTISINLYKFSELSKESKQKAIDKWYENEDYPFLADNLTEQCMELLKEKGLQCDKVELNYSLSWSQGDGLSFSAERIYIKPLFIEVLGQSKDKQIEAILEQLSYGIKGNTGRYSFASKNDIYIELETGNDYPNIENVIGKVREKLEDIYMEICKALEESGYAELEYRMSETEFNELCEANEYHFLESGIMRNS